MSRRAKGPRLWLRPAQCDATGTLTHQPTWLILDGSRQRGTGCGPSDRAGAEKALAAYLTNKHAAGISVGTRDPSQVLLDDVLTKYVRDVVTPPPTGKRTKKGHARPHETVQRVRALKAFWTGRRLSAVTGDTCRAYAEQRESDGAARRELEELRAAINHHRREGLHDKIVSVVLPEKGDRRERWLTRREAATLILGAWRYREVQNFRDTDRRTRRHVARFMVVARYMGSRASVICSASIEEKRPPGVPWVDLVNGVFYGRPAGHRDTKKRRQMVQVPLPLLAHMRRWQARGQRFVVEWQGRPIGRITKAHNATVATVGLGPDVTPHIWRHTVATWLMQRGENPADAADFLAMSVETLLRVYRHHRPIQGALWHRQRSVNDKSEQKRISKNSNVVEMAVKSLIA